MIGVGDHLPPFDVVDVSNRRHHSGALPRRLWIGLFRYASCPLCAVRLHEIRRVWDAQFAGRSVTFLAVFPSAADDLARFFAPDEPRPFSLIADGEERLYGLLHPGHVMGLTAGVLRQVRAAAAKGLLPGLPPSPAAGLRRPGDIVVDGSGVVRLAHVGKDFGDHAALDVIAAALDDIAL